MHAVARCTKYYHKWCAPTFTKTNSSLCHRRKKEKRRVWSWMMVTKIVDCSREAYRVQRGLTFGCRVSEFSTFPALFRKLHAYSEWTLVLDVLSMMFITFGRHPRVSLLLALPFLSRKIRPRGNGLNYISISSPRKDDLAQL